MQLSDFLARLDRVRQQGNEWAARCPCLSHGDGGGDHQPSLSVTGSNGRILVNCHAGCTPQQIVAALGLEMRDLFVDAKPSRRLIATYDYLSERGKVIYQVVRYEPKDFCLRRPHPTQVGKWVWGLAAGWYRQRDDGDWVRITDKTDRAMKPEPGAYWFEETRRVLYRLPEVLAADLLLIVEGEKDAETARGMGFVATCNPGGAGKWREKYSETLRGKRDAIIAHADKAGRRHGQQVATSLYGKAASLKVTELPGAKDLSEWVERGGTADALLELITNAPEWQPPAASAPKTKKPQREVADQPPAPEEASEAEPLLANPGLLKKFLDDVAALGVAGEEENCTTIELAMVSSLGERPINLTIKGESASGKNFQCDIVASLHPASRVKRLTRISAKALYYLPDDLSHKVLIFAEAVGGEDADYSIREIESSGELVMLVTEKKEGRFEASEKRVKGPVAIINTTTRAHLNPENETRHFDIVTDESEEQTARIFGEQARLYEDPAVELRRSAIRRAWQVAHGLLKPFPVLIPFASQIGKRLPRAPVRMRRDYPRVLALIAASALLHQRQRERKVVGGKEYIVASLDDYKIARELAEPMLRRSILGMSDRCVSLLTWLRKRGDGGVTVADVARGMAWTWRTAKKYLGEGEVLGVVEKLKGKYRAVAGVKAPESVLPDPETLLSVHPRAEAAQRAEPAVNPSEKKGFSPSSASSAACAPQGRDGRGKVM